MPTTTTSTIGTSSRNYSTLQAWEDACPSNLVTNDEIWKGECYNDSEFSSAINISGITTDSTRYVWLTTASGQSFADNANKLTNALKYNQSNGVGLRITGSYNKLVTVSSNINVLIEKFQFNFDSTYSSNYYIPIEGASPDKVIFKQCIYESRRTTSNDVRTSTWINSLFIQRGTSFTNTFVRQCHLYNCTIVRPSDLGASSSTAVSALYSGYNLKNCAIFGFATATTTSGGGSWTASYNASDSATLPGSNNQTSLTYSSQFENVNDSTRDFRAKSGGSLANGTPDTGNTGGIDIVGQTRSGSAPYIGAWEIVASGASGTLASTLGNTTLAAAGTTTNVGTVSQTLSNVTSAAAGTTTILGTLSLNLSAVTLAASGSVGSPVSGTVTETLDDTTLSASGTTTIVGTSAQTLANTTLSAAGTTTIVGSVNATIGNDTLAASGSVGGAVSGSVGLTLANTTLAASGTTTLLGTVNYTTENTVLAAQGTTSILGTLGVTLVNTTLVATGTSGSTVSGAAYRFLKLWLSKLGV